MTEPEAKLGWKCKRCGDTFPAWEHAGAREHLSRHGDADGERVTIQLEPVLMYEGQPDAR